MADLDILLQHPYETVARTFSIQKGCKEELLAYCRLNKFRMTFKAPSYSDEVNERHCKTAKQADI